MLYVRSVRVEEFLQIDCDESELFIIYPLIYKKQINFENVKITLFTPLSYFTVNPY